MVTWAEAKESGEVIDKLNGAERISPRRGNTGGKKHTSIRIWSARSILKHRRTLSG